MFQNEASLELKFDGAADKSCCDSVRGDENSGSSFCKDAETSFIEQIFRHRWNLHELYQKMANICKQQGFPGQLVQNDDWKINLIFQVFPPSPEQFSLYLSELVEEGARHSRFSKPSSQLFRFTTPLGMSKACLSPSFRSSSCFWKGLPGTQPRREDQPRKLPP
jgi:hypothetical protein